MKFPPDSYICQFLMNVRCARLANCFERIVGLIPVGLKVIPHFIVGHKEN